MGVVFVVLISLYLIIDCLEKKRREQRYQKIKKQFGQEAAEELEKEDMLNSTSDISIAAHMLPSSDNNTKEGLSRKFIG